jgi:hypothetical protein
MEKPMTTITSISKKYLILPTEHTNQIAEDLQINIAGKVFIVGYTYPDGRVRGYIQLDKHTLRGVFILNAEDVA